MTERRDKRGTNGTGVQTPRCSTHTGAREGQCDSELHGVPDGETLIDGSEPMSPLPVFNHKAVERWPQPVQEMVDVGRTDAQRDAMLLGALCVLGATLGPKVRTLYNGKWLSPTLMLFVVAPPASGKGQLALLRHIVQPFHDELRSDYERQLAAYKQERAKYDALGKGRATTDMKVPEPPVRRFFLIPGNNSGTGMAANLINSGGRGIIFETEADTLSAALSTDYGHFDDTLRNAFDHERVAYYRRTDDESREQAETYLSMLLSGTPGQVKPLVVSAENGLASRFLWYYMPGVQEWQSQFVCQEDLAERFRRLGREWKARVDGLREVSSLTFSLTEEQQEFFDIYMNVLFQRGRKADGGEAVSSVIRIAHHLLRMMSVVALLRCQESGEGLQPAVDIPRENLQDGICPRYTYGILHNDFVGCLMMGTVLFSHAMHILSLLPQAEVSSRASADKDLLFCAMGGEAFSRKDYLEKAAELNISENTALQWLKRGVKKGMVVRVEHGVYQFT